MLEALRRGAQTPLAKLLFAVLILSFGVFWNIDGVFRGFGRDTLATIGEETISVPEFQRRLQDEVQNLSRSAGKRISVQEASAAGIDRMLLRRMINDAAIEAHSRQMKLGISDETLADGLRKDENLQGPDGKFSRDALNEVMARMGVSEQGLFALLRKDELKRQILSAMSNALVVPAPMVETLHAWTGETRRIAHFRIDPATVKLPPTEDSALKAYYDGNKSQFMVPEYRKIAALVLSTDDIKKEMAVSDEEIQDAYRIGKETFDIPEKRRVQQIAFKDRASAEAAKKALDGGKSFSEVAKEAGATEADINLGLVTKKQLIDKTMAEAVFKLERDKVSDVIDGRFRPVIVRAVEIQPGKESKLEEVKDKIRDNLAREKAGPEIQHRYEQVEENRNLGKSLKEIGETLKIRFIEVEAADRMNKRPDGGRALDHPDERTIVDAAFSTQKSTSAEAIELKQSNGYAWVDVMSVTEAKEKPFEDAKAEVKTGYEAAERRKLIDDLASKLVVRADAGEDFDKLAAEVGGKVELSEAITRNTTPPGLDQSSVNRAFTLAKGMAGTTPTSNGETRVVFRVVEITPAAALSDVQRKSTIDEVKEQLLDDQISSYVEGLSNKLGVTINEAELKRATGGDQQ